MKILDEQNKELNQSKLDYELGYLTKKADGIFVYHLFTESELKTRRLSRLEEWFNEFFSKQLVKLFLKKDFEPLHDDVYDKDYESLEELKEQALLVKAEIDELKGE